MACGAPIVDLLETIVAIATSRGGAARGILRLSGPRAWQIIEEVATALPPIGTIDTDPKAIDGQLLLPPLANPVPATLFRSREPRSFTGQDLVEVHTLGSPPILELALSAFISRGARMALPGEFTMRAFLNGKLDLTEAEAILGLIDARDSTQADVARRQLAGGIARPIAQLRDRLLDLLVELEAGLDFAEEDLSFMDRSQLRAALEAAAAQLLELCGQMESRVLGVDRPRAVLIGAPNVGKSSLFNALLGRDAALVHQTAGTTRDYLVGELKLANCSVELADTAGIERPLDVIGEQSQSSRVLVARDADLLLWCVDSTAPHCDAPNPFLELLQTPNVMLVHTKCDLVGDSNRREGAEVSHKVGPVGNKNQESVRDGAALDPLVPFAVSSHTGDGLAGLRKAIAEWANGAGGRESAVVAGTAARCRQAIVGAEAAAIRALAALDAKAGDDLIALELRLALDELAQVVGAVYTEDILQRVFSRFCIGK